MRIHFILLAIILVSCSKPNHSIELPFEKDLIPEGIAIDTVSKKVYLNSLYKNKIVRSNLDGSNPEVFIGSNEFGYLPGFGMTIKGDTLFALGNSHDTPSNRSILLLLNTTNGALIHKYELKGDKKTYLNDIAVSENGQLFISDSESSSVYTINHETDQLEVFYTNQEIAHTNGIAISNDGKLLYLASFESGLRVLELATKKLVNQPNDFKGIDGLKFYKNSLIAIVNARRDPEKNGVFQYKLNPEGSEIMEASKLMAFENPTDIPTTFALYDGHMFFVADSQMDLLDDGTNQIIDSTKLEAYRLIRKKFDGKN